MINPPTNLSVYDSDLFVGYSRTNVGVTNHSQFGFKAHSAR